MDHAVGVLHDALHAVLGHDDGDAEVVHETGDRGEHLFGRGRVEGGGRFVEHEHARVRGEHRADGDALLLAARQGAHRPVPQLGDAEQVERLLDALAHHARLDRELLHRVGEFFLDRVGDEPGQRVLADHADHVGQVAGFVVRVSRPSTATRPDRWPPVKCGTRPLIEPSSVDLPAPVGPITRHSSPSSMVRSTSRSVGAGGVGVGER